jgi:hypothetical protein
MLDMTIRMAIRVFTLEYIESNYREVPVCDKERIRLLGLAFPVIDIGVSDWIFSVISRRLS